MPDTELVTLDAHTGEVLTTLALQASPTDTLAAAQQAAVALQQVIARKPHPVIINGQQYLEYEDWQTAGRFYGVTAKAIIVDHVTVAGVSGFCAVAVAIDVNGRDLSRAEAYCLTDEPFWASKPLFQLASMAQTRACAKALRNVLAWVVVLAGYRSTPAEEMTGDDRPARTFPKPPFPTPPPDRDAPPRDVPTISVKQVARLVAIGKDHGWTNNSITLALQGIGLSKADQMPRTEYDAFIDYLRAGPPPLETSDEGDPF